MKQFIARLLLVVLLGGQQIQTPYTTAYALGEGGHTLEATVCKI